MMAEYLNSLPAQGKSPQTVRTYAVQLNKFTAWRIMNGYGNDPKDITAVEVAEYRNYLQEQGRLPNTVNTALASVEAFCRWMADEGHIQYNPARKVKRAAQVVEPPKWLTKSERARLIRAAEKEKDIRNTAIILTLLHAGLRASELCGLEHDDVLISDRKGSIVAHGKGNKRRVVPIEKDLRYWLGKYMTERHVAGEWLFPSQRGEHLTYAGLYELCQTMGKKAGIDGLTPHMLRHTFGHELAVRGVPIQTIAVLMGHEQLEHTMIYIKPGSEELQSAVDKLSYT